MHDAVQLERLGVPATLVLTEPFQGLAASFADNLGMPGYPAVVVPHPVASRDDEQLRKIAASVTDDVVMRLTGG